MAQEPDQENRRLKGIFSRRSAERKKASAYFFAKESAPGEIQLRKLGENYVPQGENISVDRELFLKAYQLEPNLWYQCVTGRLVRGDALRRSERAEEASIQYRLALEVDEENIRGMYGLGLCYLSMKQLKKATYVFERLVALDESFEVQHKHLFNEFGIGLRKQGLFDEAKRHYSRALDLAPTDEHLNINMARTQLEQGDPEAAFRSRRRAVEINPDHPCILAFLRHMIKQGQLPQDESCAEGLREAMKKALASNIRLEDLGC